MTDQPTLAIDIAEQDLSLTALGIVPFAPIGEGSYSTIQDALDAIGNGVLPPNIQWEQDMESSMFAISYVHAPTSQWSGSVLRDKMTTDTRERILRELTEVGARGCWIDQCLAQRRGDGSAWAVLGLMPYAAMRVLVVGNLRPLQDVVQAYVTSVEAEGEDAGAIITYLYEILDNCWQWANGNSAKIVIDFVEMLRFWPIMERAMGHKGRGLYYEFCTIHGLHVWVKTLTSAIARKKEQAITSHDKVGAHGIRLLEDMLDSAHSIILSTEDTAETGSELVEENLSNIQVHREKGKQINAISALAVVTGALGSGAVANAKLYQPEDRTNLMIAGMCFSLLATLQPQRPVTPQEVMQIIEDPGNVFGVFSENIAATPRVTSLVLARANFLYNRSAIHAGAMASFIADEVTLYSQESLRVPISRVWNGQWELVPHLAHGMKDYLLDIGERSLNSKACKVLSSAAKASDTTGKHVCAVLSGSSLTEQCSTIPIIAFSTSSASWNLRPIERPVFEKEGLGGWTSTPLFLGIVDTVSRTFYVQAFVLTHLSHKEEKYLQAGKISSSEVLGWVRMFMLRSICPVEKRNWLNCWILRHFKRDNENDISSLEWYCRGISIKLEDYCWLKWFGPDMATSLDEIKSRTESPDSNLKSMAYIKLSCVGPSTPATVRQVDLMEVVMCFRQVMLTSPAKRAASLSSGSSQSLARLTGSEILEYGCAFLSAASGNLGSLGGDEDDLANIVLMVPAYRRVNSQVQLTSSEIITCGSFYRCAAACFGLNASSWLNEKNERTLVWNMSAAGDFYEAQKLILHTAHIEGFLLTVVLLCHMSNKVNSYADTNSASAETGSSSTPHPIHSPQITTGSTGRWSNLLGIASYRVASMLADSPVVCELLIDIIEHLIENSRGTPHNCTWSLRDGLKQRIYNLCRASSQDGSTGYLKPRVPVLEAVCVALDSVQSMMEHVRTARIIRRPDQATESAVEESFAELFASYCKNGNSFSTAILRNGIDDVETAEPGQCNSSSSPLISVSSPSDGWETKTLPTQFQSGLMVTVQALKRQARK